MITPKDLNEWYNVIDVLSQAVYAEGFGLPVMEAQSAGTPVITTDASSWLKSTLTASRSAVSLSGTVCIRAGGLTLDVTEMVAAYEEAYEQRKTVDRKKLRRFAQTYSTPKVSKKYMQPALAELIDRVKDKVPQPVPSPLRNLGARNGYLSPSRVP